MLEENMPRLENWSIVNYGEFCQFEGVVYNHPEERLNKTEAHTSSIVSIDLSTNTAYTRSRKYKLGDINPLFMVMIRSKGKTLKEWCDKLPFAKSPEFKNEEVIPTHACKKEIHTIYTCGLTYTKEKIDECSEYMPDEENKCIHLKGQHQCYNKLLRQILDR